MTPNRKLHEANRLSWNAATVAHNSHKRDQAKFLREGGSTLFAEEIALLGAIEHLDLLHLQCNSGQDSLSLAARGARVTGVDISDEAIAFAKRLSTDAAIAACFERADVYDWLAQAALDDRRFDIVFFSYGALCWLSDLDAWARAIHAVLRPGGRLVGIEFHPFVAMLDDDAQLRYGYQGETIPWTDGVRDYVALSGDDLSPSGRVEGIGDFRNPHPCHEFTWGLAQVTQAVLDAGLSLRHLREYPYSNGCRLFNTMRELPGRRYAMAEPLPDAPLMFSLVASRD